MIKPFVVYVTFPNSSKEYCYLCKLPRIRQGDQLIANGARVTVVRTANDDPLASRYVSPLPDAKQIQNRERKKQIEARLREIGLQLKQEDYIKGIARRSPEARKLWGELKQITKDL